MTYHSPEDYKKLSKERKKLRLLI